MKSSEEIADEIQSEALQENIPYYAALIESYADRITTATIDTLKERMEETKDNPMMPDEFISKKEVLNLIDEVRNE